MDSTEKERNGAHCLEVRKTFYPVGCRKRLLFVSLALIAKDEAGGSLEPKNSKIAWVAGQVYP